MLILEKTPFYAEMGGQVGDTGKIGPFEVYDCTQPFPGVIAHLGKMGAGTLKKNASIRAEIDRSRRQNIQNNHTATHLLHWALQKVLGEHIKQAGSLVDDKRLRFDFSHHKALSPDEVRKIEDLVNEKVRSDEAVNAYELSYEDAQKRADIKQFFGEKYGAKVRVIDIDFSKELCGGTHTKSVGTIGLVKILKESSVAAGVRRMEAVSGLFAELHVRQEEDLLQAMSAQLKAPISTLSEKLQNLLDENKQLAQEIKTLKKGQLKGLIEESLAQKEQVGSISLIAKEVNIAPEELADFANELIQKMGSGVVALGLTVKDRCQLLVAISPDLAATLSALNLIQEAAPLIQGGGGGRAHLAQAGGKNPSGLTKALAHIRTKLLQL
jgi:alanyl-tRNA synthetase